MTTSKQANRKPGYVLAVSTTPQGFLTWLESTGLATTAIRCADDVFIEPAQGIDRVLEAMQRAGIRVRDLRQLPPGTPRPSTLEGAREAHRRLRCVRCAEWLPVLPAA